MQQQIVENIAKHISLDAAETYYFMGLLKQENIAKKQFILREGQLCKNINYVQIGTLRAYYVDKEGKESTVMFAIADWWITDMFCFLHQQPAMLFIEAVENSIIFQLQKDDLEELYNKVPKFEKYFRVLMQNAYVREQLRVLQNLSLSAEERYLGFVAKYPKIVTQITQKQIASYLGITPEFLSAIRKVKSNT